LDITLPRNYEDFKNHLKDPLYKNSFFILLTLITSAGIGFLFWIIAAKIYPQEEVGLNTALISVVSLIALISFLGLDQSLIRFFPERDKFKILTTSCLVITISTIIIGIIFVLGVNLWSPGLSMIWDNLIIFFLAIIAFSLITPTANAFIASRKSNYYFLQNLSLSSRLVLVLLPVFGKLGIFISFSISCIIGVLFSIYLIHRLKLGKFSVKKALSIDWDFLKQSFRFSIVNYYTMLFATVPGYLLPIIVLNVLGGEQTAYYYIAYTIAYLLFMISGAFGTSLFVEGSHGRSLKTNTLRSIVGIFIILVPIALFFFFFGDYVLLIIGKSYINGFNLLKAFIVSSFFYTICQLYLSILKVQKRLKELTIVSFIIFVLLISLSYILMYIYGIVGVGYAWIISYSIGMVLIIVIELIKPKPRL
jgi:O-antigen/teichoic acid export membrane protein